MKRAPVDSSSIRSIGYDAATETLEVEFHHGHAYRYAGVPRLVYQNLMRAESIGAYYVEFVRDRYPYTRLD